MKDKVHADIVADITINYDGYNVIGFTCHGVRIVKKEKAAKQNRALPKKRIQKDLEMER